MFVALQSYGVCLIILKLGVKMNLRKNRTLNYQCSIQKKDQMFRFLMQNCTFYASVFI